MRALQLTEVNISPDLKSKCRNVALGCVEGEVRSGPTPPELDAALRGFQERIAKLPEPRATLESTAIETTRAGYKALGKDPARYRGSAEALLRRAISGKGLPRINNVVDVINLVSAENKLPVGLYDLAHVAGAIEFRAGRAGETYKGIGKYDLNLEDLPLFADAKGPHGSATSDSERTMVTESTTKIIAIIVSFAGPNVLQQATKRMQELLEVHCSARNIETRIVS
jgi:DNA/RNA-binding domain of Phe-tRNA-synthetase-like protein